MFAVRKTIQAAPRVCRLALQQRGMSVYGPPRVRISFPEKLAHGAVIAVGATIGPIWILHHLEEYKGKPEEEEE